MLGLLLASVLPVIEHVQPLSLAFLSTGIVAFALMWNRRLRARLVDNVGMAVLLIPSGIPWLAGDLSNSAGHLLRRLRTRTDFWGAWALPVLVGGLFLVLFAIANPVIEHWLAELGQLSPGTEPLRVVFWVIVATATWPLLALSRHLPDARPEDAAPAPHWSVFLSLVNARSVTNSLVLFNALFAVQTVLDLAYLWGGVALPDGMTFAGYAHRGAYPLVATALLSAGFVTVATTFVEPTPLIRRLIYLWVTQNLVLLMSAVLRLDLYVDAFLLTRLRLAAFIWMGLVALGFVLIVLRMVLGRSNRWLFFANAAAALAVLYVCCFVNFSGLIANYNVAHSRPLDPSGPPLDWHYLHALGPSSLPAMFRYQKAVKADHVPTLSPLLIRSLRPRSWREWQLRDGRIGHHLAALREAQGRAN